MSDGLQIAPSIPPAFCLAALSILNLITPSARAQDDIAEARGLSARAEQLAKSGRLHEALPLADRAVTLLQQSTEAQTVEIATAQNNLGEILSAIGDYGRATLLLEQSLQKKMEAFGLESPLVAVAFARLATVHRAKGSLKNAEELYRRSAAILERDSTGNNQDLAVTLNGLGEVYRLTGNYASAEPLLSRALSIREKVLGAEQPGTAVFMANLAALHADRGDWPPAEALYTRALEILEKVAGPEHPNVGALLNGLAAVYRARGNFARAEPLFQRAISIAEKTLPRHRGLATAYNNLAELYQSMGDPARAMLWYSRSLALLEDIGAAGQPVLAGVLNNLGSLYYSSGDYARALPFLLKSVSIREGTLGPDHLDTAISLHNLAALYDATSDYRRAAQLYDKSLGIWRRNLPPNHPQIAIALENIASMLWASGSPRKAVEALLKAADIREAQLRAMLIGGSEDQKRAFLATLPPVDAAVSLHLRELPNDPQALQVALTFIFQRKGRIFDALSHSMAALRSRMTTEQRGMLAELSGLRMQQAALWYSGDKPSQSEMQDKLRQLGERAESLETALSAASVDFRSGTERVTSARIQGLLSSDESLISLIRYAPFSPERVGRGPARYAAYVLSRDAIGWKDLGEAHGIDLLVNNFRRALRDYKDAPAAYTRGRQLYEQLIAPIEPLFGGRTRLLLAPDGSLNVIPFSALIDRQGKYLLESYAVTYLSSERDFVRLSVKTQTSGHDMLMGNIDYDAHRGTVITPPEIGGLRMRFKNLAGMGAEAGQLAALLPRSVLLEREAASEDNLKQAKAPRVLHIATHGYFLDDLPDVTSASPLRKLTMETGPRLPAIAGMNPLLRSGLIFAGANTGGVRQDDGILTALEASGVDLWGTQMVVLSACETGLGDVANGEGVYGLRRAIALAGSRTQVLSLWTVDDSATRDLMVRFYRRLLKGETRRDAFQSVQIEMLREPKWAHPYYWAAFIMSGDGGRLPSN